MTNHNEETSFIYGSVAGHRRKRTGLGGEVRHLGRKKRDVQCWRSNHQFVLCEDRLNGKPLI